MLIKALKKDKYVCKHFLSSFLVKLVVKMKPSSGKLMLAQTFKWFREKNSAYKWYTANQVTSKPLIFWLCGLHYRQHTACYIDNNYNTITFFLCIISPHVHRDWKNVHEEKQLTLCKSRDFQDTVEACPPCCL